MTESFGVTQPGVGADEMAFAISLFMAAANGKIAPPSRESKEYSLRDELGFGSDPLLVGASTVLKEQDQRGLDDVPLACAVSVLWHHYDSDERQGAICARLVAFYSLMVRTRGALLQSWTKDSTLNPQEVVLSPAIVEAVATAPLGVNGQFHDVDFRALVNSLTERDGGSGQPPSPATNRGELAHRTAAALAVTDVVQQLSQHLYAFQACVAALPEEDGRPHFRVVEQLCSKVVSMSGNTTLKALLSRAISATRLDFPWLGSASLLADGKVAELGPVSPNPDFQELMECEMAILGSLIELLRSLLGDTVTLQLVRSLWPLASLSAPIS